MSQNVENPYRIDLTSTSRAEIALIHFEGDCMHWSEFLLVNVDRSVPNTIELTFLSRFRSPETTKSRLTACDVSLSFNTPSSASTFVIASPPVINAIPSEETSVTRTKSCRAAAGAGVSYFATLCARFSRSSMQRWSVIEKETQEGVNRGFHGVDLRFSENRQLKKGLNGDKHVSIRMESIEGVSCIQGTFDARFGYTTVNPFGFTRSHLEEVTATFTLTL